MRKKCFVMVLVIILSILTLLKCNLNNNMLAVYIDNELKVVIPSKSENLYIDKIDCDNDVAATWDNDNWGLFINNLSKKTKCNLHFIHDTEKPYWQVESVEKTSVLSTDIFEFKISGNDSLGNVSSTLDVSNLSFYVNDTLESPIKVELIKQEESSQKITYSIKVHMVGGEGSLKVKISGDTLTDTSSNQNDEITIDTGINVSKNPAKIFLYYDKQHSQAQISEHNNTISKYYEFTIDNAASDLNDFNQENYDLIIFDFEGWSVPSSINNLSNINIISCGNDTTSALEIIQNSTYSPNIVGTSNKVVNNSLTNYLPDAIVGDTDNQYLINFSSDVTVLYKNTTNGIIYDSIGYRKNNNYTWLHYQLYRLFGDEAILIPIIEFTLGELK